MLGATIGTLAFLAALGAWAGHAKASEAPKRPPAYGAVVLAALLSGLVKYAKKGSFIPNELNGIVRMAVQVGLPKTAAALQAGGPLPADEMWPGTATSVRDRVQLKIAGV